MEHIKAVEMQISHRYSFYNVRLQGGMGTVLKAWDRQKNRDVAIKIPVTHIQSDDSSMEKRFIREVIALHYLSYPSPEPNNRILKWLDFPETNHKNLYVILEWVDGKPLKQHFMNLPWKWEKIYTLALEMCEALTWVHARNIIHRDVNPNNIMVRRDGSYVLIDFGNAAIYGESTVELTRVGVPPAHTPHYFAPERYQNEKKEKPFSEAAKDDQYSLGCVLYKAATGLIYNRGSDPIRQLNPEIPASLASIIEKMTAYTPNVRFETMLETLHAFEEIRSKKQSYEFAKPGDERKVTNPEKTVIMPMQDPKTMAANQPANSTVIMPSLPKNPERIQYIKKMLKIAIGVLTLVFVVLFVILFSSEVFQTKVKVQTTKDWLMTYEKPCDACYFPMVKEEECDKRCPVSGPIMIADGTVLEVVNEKIDNTNCPLPAFPVMEVKFADDSKTFFLRYDEEGTPHCFNRSNNWFQPVFTKKQNEELVQEKYGKSTRKILYENFAKYDINESIQTCNANQFLDGGGGCGNFREIPTYITQLKTDYVIKTGHYEVFYRIVEPYAFKGYWFRNYYTICYNKDPNVPGGTRVWALTKRIDHGYNP